MTDYKFAYIDEQTKSTIRCAIPVGVEVPGYQVPTREPLCQLDPTKPKPAGC